MVFLAKDLIEIGRNAERNEGSLGIRGSASKARVVIGKESLADVAVGHLALANTARSQLVHQAILEGAVQTLAASPGLRRVGNDVLDPQPLQRPAYLRELALV